MSRDKLSSHDGQRLCLRSASRTAGAQARAKPSSPRGRDIVTRSILPCPAARHPPKLAIRTTLKPKCSQASNASLLCHMGDLTKCLASSNKFQYARVVRCPCTGGHAAMSDRDTTWLPSPKSKLFRHPDSLPALGGASCNGTAYAIDLPATPAHLHLCHSRGWKNTGTEPKH
ncbi:hypothetical protein J7T55_006168 [Diaporthe amygdali]|uniref:uncharacterized protein n=1 Tax=Phomopsis amygdali TaxID=1214568 RepID=UPI0022FE65A2|nr:uncharacterized protein J7T55_006168 [Diaporthe amygdali]KAJ0124825.1 hypothetical protein J7T55_006168 [Diaporthe amygdali]